MLFESCVVQCESKEYSKVAYYGPFKTFGEAHRWINDTHCGSRTGVVLCNRHVFGPQHKIHPLNDPEVGNWAIRVAT